MREEQHRFLALLGDLPARLTAEQAAWVLNCQAHDIPTLVSSGLLKPLGNPPPNGIKFFGTAALIRLTKDGVWLVKVTRAVDQHWQRQSARRKGRSGIGSRGRASGHGRCACQTASPPVPNG